MNYYIDFDNTLYNTPLLTEKMLTTLSTYVSEKKAIDYNSIYKSCQLMFNYDNIYNIYELTRYLCNKHSLEPLPIISNINEIILQGENFVFEDSISFLKNLKLSGHNIYLLSYAKNNLQYQIAKITGSKLAHFFDALYITSKEKYKLDINYTNGIFIDDNPSDLSGLYSKNPIKVIRLRRDNNKHSLENLKNENIKEYSNFLEVPID